MDFATDLIISEAQSSEEIKVTDNTRKKIGRFVVQEDEAGRMNAMAEHNRQERTRRKSLKESLMELRNQLKRPTRKPSMITVLRAAQEEIRELSAVQDNDIGRLESLNKHHSHLQWKLEELMDDIKKLPQNTESLSTSFPMVSLPASRSALFPHLPSSASQASFLMGHNSLVLPKGPMSSGFLNLASLSHPITPPTSSTFSLYPHSIQPYTLFLPPPSHLRLPAHLQPFSVQDNILPHPLSTSFPSSPDPNFLPSSFQLLPPPLIQPQLPTLGIPGFSKPSLCPSLLFAEKPYQPRSCTEYHGSQQTGFPLTEFSHTPRASTTMTMPAVANPFTLSLTTNNSELFCSPLTTLHKGTETATKAKAIQFPAGVFFSNEYLDTVSSQEKMKLGGSDEDRGEEKGSCSSTKRMSMSPSQSVLVDKEGKNENYACGRKKRRRKKRRGEEYKNNCDSELEGSSLPRQVRTVKGKPRRVSSHVGTTSSATAQKREKKQKSVNRWSCASPQLQIAIMESNDNSSQRSRNGTATMIDLASECKIRMSTSRKELYTDQPPTQNKNDSNLDSCDSCSKQYLSLDGQHLLGGFHC